MYGKSFTWLYIAIMSLDGDFEGSTVIKILILNNDVIITLRDEALVP